jgi:hypothetical protein
MVATRWWWLDPAELRAALAVHSHVVGDHERLIIPIVLAIHVSSMSIALDSHSEPFVQVNCPELISRLKMKLDQQRPSGWNVGNGS